MFRPYQLRAYKLSKSKCLAQSYPPEGLETKISNFQLLSEITLTGTGAFKMLAQEIRLKDEIWSFQVVKGLYLKTYKGRSYLPDPNSMDAPP